MKTIEFEMKSYAVLMVHIFGQSPCDVEPSHVIAWYKAAPAEVRDEIAEGVGWPSQNALLRTEEFKEQATIDRARAEHFSAECDRLIDEVKRLRCWNRTALAEVAERLCKTVTVAKGETLGCSVWFAHFLGLTGLEEYDEPDAANEVNAVRSEIHKIVFDTEPDKRSLRYPCRSHTVHTTERGVINRLLAKFGIAAYVGDDDPVEFASRVLVRRVVASCSETTGDQSPMEDK